MTYLDRCLHILVNQFDGTCRTDLRTTGTLRTAVTMLVRHHRQHQVHQVRRRAQHLVRTFRDTELTARTMLSEVVEGERAWRRERRLTLRSHLVFNLRQATIHQFLLLLGNGSGSDKSRSQQETALGSIDGARRCGFSGRSRRAGIFQCSEFAGGNAIAANHATTIIHSMRLVVDAGGLAVLRAERTVLALLLVEVDLQP